MRGNHIEAMSEFDDNIILPKYIFHRYKVLEDTIFCEPRLQKYSPQNPNRYSWEDFNKLISRK